MTRRLIAPVVLTAAALTLTACGGGASSAPSGTTIGSSATTGTSSTGATASNSASTGTTASGGSKTSSTGSSTTPGSSGGTPTSSGSSSVLPNPTGYSTPTTVLPVGSGCVPSRLSVSSVGIDGEQVVAMGTNAQGQIYPPPKTTMWYDKSAQLGTNGRTVIAGHVTYDGPDEFYDLDQVRIGAPIDITCTDGRNVTYTVTNKRSELKTKVTTDQQVWGGSSSSVLVLITCDKNSPIIGQHHLNNYVVWAAPAGA